MATTEANTSGFYNVTEPFWDHVTGVWNHGLFGVDIGSIIIALVIFGFFLVLREVLGKIILRLLKQWAGDSKNNIDERVVPVLLPPAKFIPVILGVFFAAQFMDLPPAGHEFFSKLVRSMIALTIFWSIYLIAEPLGHSLKRLERSLSPLMMTWILKVMKVLVVFIGGAVILEIWGIKVAPLLAGLGLFGAAVALGAQDFFKNLIGGMSVIAEKRFQPGDWILVEDVVEGTVEEIGFRSTKIRRFDKAPMYVPNSKLSDAVVTNFSRMTYRRINWNISLSYKTTVEELQQIRDLILQYINEQDENFAPQNDNKPTVRIDTLNETGMNLTITCFTRTTAYDEYIEIKEALALAVKDIVENKVKASFATTTPATSIYVGEKPTGKSENSRPVGGKIN